MRILVIENLVESEIKNELEKVVKDIEVLIALTYKEGIKHIIKYGNKINLVFIHDNAEFLKNSALLDMLELNNIKTIITCDDIENLPSEIVLSKNCIVDCIVKYNKFCIKNILKSITRIVKNIDKNVLVVDDSKIQLSIITKVLKKINCNVTTANDGTEALEIIKNSNKKFDLILVDYYMPNMNGLMLTLKIRENYAKDELSIIIISSNNKPEIVSQFLKIGANDFIYKPYNETEIQTRINSNFDLLELFTKTKNMANRDFLTGAYNRRYFFETGNLILNKAKRNKSNVALCMIDIDKFKNINDTYGHDVGDLVICSVSNLLKTQIRVSDIMARFGGEEFCIIIDNISCDNASNFFEKIRIMHANNSIEINSYKINYTISIGIFYGLVSNLDDMIKVADNGLYYCKRNGRNKIKMIID